MKIDIKKCPFCAEDIKAEAVKCKHCGEFLIAKREKVNIGMLLQVMKGTISEAYQRTIGLVNQAKVSLAHNAAVKSKIWPTIKGCGRFFRLLISIGLIGQLMVIISFLFLRKINGLETSRQVSLVVFLIVLLIILNPMWVIRRFFIFTDPDSEIKKTSENLSSESKLFEPEQNKAVPIKNVVTAQARKPTRGITILAWLYLITGIIGVLNKLYFLANPPQILLDQSKYNSTLLVMTILIVLLISSVLSIFIGRSFFSLKEVWRKIAIGQALCMICYWVVNTFIFHDGSPIVLIATAPLLEFFALFYLSRGKVKAQFVNRTACPTGIGQSKLI